ncbi:glycosyltransferase [uncultured Psychroserpens sp.]|uniref:glycosyltransferase family 4 protein n=1 Tax=uncultured Psychroserpens sp. TaxID=255436 RepID=UPI002618C3F5|nr:glycosyltransferase [uncultured Psychroserpens sp.]
MKIGIVLSRTPSYSETFFRAKIEGLIRCGLKVELFVQERDPNFNLCTVNSAPKAKGNFAYFLALWSVVKLLIRFPKRFKTFVSLEKQAGRSWIQLLKNIHLNYHTLTAQLDWLHFGFATMAIQSENVAQAINSKMSVSLRGYDIDVYPESHPNCYDLLWKKVDKVHSISKYLLEKANVLGFKKSSYQIIYPAVDLTKLKPIDDQYSKLNEITQLLTVGRLHPIKGFDYVLEALSILKSKQIPFLYTIIGEGSELDRLKNDVERLNLKSEVNFIGKRPHDEVFSFMMTSDIYIQYSLSEGFCNAVLEAQASGLLCVVSDGGALPENIIHHKTGYVVPKKNPAELANTLEKVINLCEEDQIAILTQAKLRVESKFNLANQIKDFITFYEANSFLSL